MRRRLLLSKMATGNLQIADFGLGIHIPQRHFLNRLLLSSMVCIMPSLAANCFAQTAATNNAADPRTNSASVAQQLGSIDPTVRRAAAESLAQLAAVDQKKVVEGFRLQEKDKKVRLALDWALYRMGKSEALFQLVRELDSSRHKQAVAYLGQVDSPSVLYPFLRNEDNLPRVTVGLIESLSRIGDAETLELIEPFRRSFYPGVAEAAEKSTEEIEKRLAQIEESRPTRPRTIGKTSP